MDCFCKPILQVACPRGPFLYERSNPMLVFEKSHQPKSNHHGKRKAMEGWYSKWGIKDQGESGLFSLPQGCLHCSKYPGPWRCSNFQKTFSDQQTTNEIFNLSKCCKNCSLIVIAALVWKNKTPTTERQTNCWQSHFWPLWGKTEFTMWDLVIKCFLPPFSRQKHAWLYKLFGCTFSHTEAHFVFCILLL